MTTPQTLAALLEMAAENNGFDRELPRADGWLVFASTQSPLKIWLRPFESIGAVVALSLSNVARSLDTFAESPVALPPGARAAKIVLDQPSLHRFLRRAFQLSKALPDAPLRAFEERTRALPRATEAERLVVQRVGQTLFREGLLDYWDGRCAVTGLAVPELLRASHIKPWAACGDDAERLDVFNGLLLGPNLDAAFDRGFVTVGEDGGILAAPELSPEDRAALGLREGLRVRGGLREGHERYLRWHREEIFRGAKR